jgi:2'-5' RNA ligase
MSEQPPRPERRRRPKGPKFTKQRPSTDSVDTRPRLFLAVPLPPPVTEKVTAVTRGLEQEGWPVRWTSSGNAHITLHFLGETEPERARLLQLAIGPVVAEHPGFDLRTADLGVFPTMKRPRIIWLGVHGPTHRLLTLRDAIGDLLEEFEFELQEREFHPHITLGRVRNTRDISVRNLPVEIRTRIEAAMTSGEVTSKDPLPIPVREVLLMRSHLGKDGPRYETLAAYPLGPAVFTPARSLRKGRGASDEANDPATGAHEGPGSPVETTPSDGSVA